MNLALKLGVALDMLLDARNFIAETSGQSGLLGDLIDNHDQLSDEEKERKNNLVNDLQEMVTTLEGFVEKLSDLRANELIRS